MVLSSATRSPDNQAAPTRAALPALEQSRPQPQDPSGNGQQSGIGYSPWRYSAIAASTIWRAPSCICGEEGVNGAGSPARSGINRLGFLLHWQSGQQSSGKPPESIA